MSDMQVNRALVERAVVFLEQYKEKLATSKYPPDLYKKDSIEDIVQQLRRACNG